MHAHEGRLPCQQPMRKQLQMIVVTVALAALAGASGAVAATNFKTKNAAYQSARSCLLQQGATQVGRRADGGGFVYFRGLRMTWSYKTSNGLVSGVTSVTPPGLVVAAYRKLFVACITKGI
jgi:outer membrane lipoprotein-sorting protein